SERAPGGADGGRRIAGRASGFGPGFYRQALAPCQGGQEKRLRSLRDRSGAMGVPAPALRILSDGDEVRVLWEEVELGDRSVTIERPEDPGSLIQGWCDRADPDILIPYWAEIWPSSRSIAKRLQAEPL